MSIPAPPPILSVDGLHVSFPVYGGIIPHKKGEVRAVEGVSFTLGHGETVGLVGESGCGKTTVGRAIVNILRPMSHGVEVDGSVHYHHSDGLIDLANLSQSEMRRYRADLQMVFQDPYSSLNPRMTVGRIVDEPLRIHSRTSRADREARVRWLLEKVGLSAEHSRRYPHEFSGGQRQRIGIARALATNPKIVIADEPVSALDVSIQAQVINLMQDLQAELGLSYLFIAHDLSVVRHISNRICVMYLGRIVEAGPAEEIYRHPLHPYSRMLLSAVPRPDPAARKERSHGRSDDPPSVLNKPSGCAFRTRCPIARAECANEVPALEPRGSRVVACPYTE